jgi:uncharacterized protein YccT (UPF0319 family)
VNSRFQSLLSNGVNLYRYNKAEADKRAAVAAVEARLAVEVGRAAAAEASLASARKAVADESRKGCDWRLQYNQADREKRAAELECARLAELESEASAVGLYELNSVDP